MGNQLNVLIIEDSKEDTLLLVRELKKGGYHPTFERVDTEKAINNALDDHVWDIVISDYVMPDLSGLDALNILKKKGMDLPFIMLSGKISEDIMVEAMRAGANDYIMKDNLSRLVPAIKRELNEAKIRRERKEAEKALKRSENLYRTIFENTGTLMTIIEEDMTIFQVNTEFEKFSGYSKAELIKKKNLAEFVADSDLNRMKGYYRLQKIDPDAVPKNYEVRLVNRHGDFKDFFATFDIIPEAEKRIGSFIDITDRKKAEDKIRSSLKEKELLLREIHHRVKNNMQIISTLLSLQSDKIKDKKIAESCKDIQNRIQAMALIHENLYKSQDLASVNLAEYIQNIINELFQTYGIDTNVIYAEIIVDEVFVNIETAIPCGLIINEIVTNSLKHAFPNGRKGKISVNLHLDNDKLALTINDDGIQFPEDLEFEGTETLGLQLVENLTKQLDGELVVDKDRKKFTITFEELRYKERI